MSNPAPAGSPPEVASPAATVNPSNPFATFLEVHLALPALEAACGLGFAGVTRERVNSGPASWQAWRNALIAAGEAASPEGKAAIPFGDALALAAEAKRLILAEAREQDAKGAAAVALALCPEGPTLAEAEADIADVEAGKYDPRGWASAVAPEGRGWATLYTLESRCGGPEEGGWWYDWQTGVATVSVAAFGSEEAAVAHLTALAESLGLSLAGEGKRGHRSACPDVDAVIHTGERLPFMGVSTFRPRYE